MTPISSEESLQTVWHTTVSSILDVIIQYLYGNETKVTGNRLHQFRLTTVAQQSFRVNLCIISDLQQLLFMKESFQFYEPGSSGSIVSDCGQEDRAIGVRSPAGVKDFPLACVSRLALRPTQPPVQWVPGVIFLG
jgi:hypothetical protein